MRGTVAKRLNHQAYTAIAMEPNGAELLGQHKRRLYRFLKKKWKEGAVDKHYNPSLSHSQNVLKKVKSVCKLTESYLQQFVDVVKPVKKSHKKAVKRKK